MLNEALVNEGYSIFIAMDGQQALAIASRMAPDIVLMDAIMPNMDGFEACRELKKNSELVDVPVIFMTGLSDSEHVVKGLESGGIDYVSKPINLDELLARIKVHLNSSRLARSARSALNEIGQFAFACDANGHLMWSTDSARELLSNTGASEDWIQQTLPEQIRYWLSHKPDRNSALWLTGLDKPLQLQYVARSSPGEFLLRLLDDDEVTARIALRKQFSLTEREAEVLFWLARGKTNRDIAQILSMSPRTVNKHLEPVYRKLSVENRTAAAALCLQFLNSR